MPRRVKKQRRTSSVPVASMGDIAFLLIIFFLLASEFNKNKELDLTTPQSSQVKKIEKKIAGRVDIDKKGDIYVNGKLVQDAKAVEMELTGVLQQTISDDQRHIQFRCDVAQTRDIFEPVLQAIAEAGGIVEAVGEKVNE